MARAALRDDVYAEQAALTAKVLRAGADAGSPRERLDAWLAENRGPVERCVQVLADIRTAGSPDLARLSVAVREVRNLISASGAAESMAEANAVRAARS
jgi:glutamate dehydrogenase